MRINSNFFLNFKGTAQNDGQTQEVNIPKTNEEFPEVQPTLSSLQAYSLSGIKSKTGVENMDIIPDYDSYSLICSIKANDPKSQSVKFTYNISSDKNPREAFSTRRNPQTGMFEIKIPALNRKTNAIENSITLNSVEYYDASNQKIDSEVPENLKIKPTELLNLRETRTTMLDGEITTAPFDAVSEGLSEGKLAEIEYEDLIRYKEKTPIIAILSNNDMNNLFMEISEGTFTLPMNVKGIVASPKGYKQGSGIVDCLGHAVSRLRGRKTFVLVDSSIMDSLKAKYLNNSENPYLQIKLNSDKMEIKGLQELTKADTSAVKVPEYKFVNRLLTPVDDEFSPESVGLKAFNLGQLAKVQYAGGFKVPKFFVFPSGMWNEVKKAPENNDAYGTDTPDLQKIGGYHFCVQKANNAESPVNELKGIRRLIVEDITLPKDIRKQVKEKAIEVFDIRRIVKDNGCLIARSSFNGEDSDTMATQGLYDSFPGIRTAENLYKGIKEVEASKWSDLAFVSRRNHGIDHGAIQGNVIIQEVVPVDYTFTINTADPRKNDKNRMVIQLSQGVYSCFPKSPYIFEYDKTTKEITRKALATKQRTKPIAKMVMDDEKNEKYDLADYSNDPLNMSKKDYDPIMRKIFEVAEFIEKSFGNKPQDIEGGVIFKTNEKTGMMEPEIHIWQTRDVHLIKR